MKLDEYFAQKQDEVQRKLEKLNFVVGTEYSRAFLTGQYNLLVEIRKEVAALQQPQLKL